MIDRPVRRAFGLNNLRWYGGAATFGAFAFLFAVFIPAKANIAVLKCESHALHTDDEQHLLTSARGVLPPDIEPFITHPCRNPGNAHAGIMTAHVKTSTGVIQWWELACQRILEDWECDPPEFKQFIDARLLVRGKLRRVALSFGKDTSLSRAQQLSSLALAIYVDPASRLPWCSREDPQDSDWAALRQRNPLPAGTKPIHVSVSRDRDAESVTLDDIFVGIQFPLSLEALKPTARCWNEWIVAS